MRRTSTEKYLTLGMALTADKKTMERRVRGVFDRKNSPHAIKALALLLCVVLGVGCFTTACKVATTTPTASDGDAMSATNGNAAVASSGNASSGNAEAATTREPPSKEQVIGWQTQELEQARTYVVPRITGIWEDESGDWKIDENPDAVQQTTAAESFLEIANAVFTTDYTADDMIATYYTDETEFRNDVWRFDSTDGVLSGAVAADSYEFLSANCTKEPSDVLHESLAEITNISETDVIRDSLDSMSAASRIAKAFSGEAGEFDYLSGSYSNVRYGWGLNLTLYFPLGDGRYCVATIYADENLTPRAVGIYPDTDCVFEDVFWRADLRHAEDVSVQQYPNDFSKGEPGADDMPVDEAYEFYYTLVKAAGSTYGRVGEELNEPNATFYVDNSGARENYWHIEGEAAIFDLTCQTKHMLNFEANQKLGVDMELFEIAYDDMGGEEYIAATEAFFTALFGEGSVVKTMVNAVYDYHYCTVDVVMSDDTSYELMYEDGLLLNAQFFASLDDMGWGTDPNWKADWIYVNTETGETYHMDW